MSLNWTNLEKGKNWREHLTKITISKTTKRQLLFPTKSPVEVARH